MEGLSITSHVLRMLALIHRLWVLLETIRDIPVEYQPLVNDLKSAGNVLTAAYNTNLNEARRKVVDQATAHFFIALEDLSRKINKYRSLYVRTRGSIWRLRKSEFDDIRKTLNLYLSLIKSVIHPSTSNFQAPFPFEALVRAVLSDQYSIRDSLAAIQDSVQNSNELLNSEKLPITEHRTFSAGSCPFRHISELGRGISSIVDSVECHMEGPLAGKILARKVFRLNAGQSVGDIGVSEEVRIMNRLRHQHIASIVLTYEEQAPSEWTKKSYGILMEPVADGNLDDFLSAVSASGNASMRSKMIKWYGCLASGLAFIHRSRVRHKDIKPSNIVIKGEDVLYVDFGISKDFDEESETVTTGQAGQKTPMYCAPEVAAEEPRGRPADMFSLGCVFSEMLTVSLGDSRKSFAEFRGEQGARAFHLDQGERSLRWLLHLVGQVSSKDCEYDRPLASCFSMLRPNAQERIDATDLAKMMRASEKAHSPGTSHARCDCLSTTEYNSQSIPNILIDAPLEVVSNALVSACQISWYTAIQSWIYGPFYIPAHKVRKTISVHRRSQTRTT